MKGQYLVIGLVLFVLVIVAAIYFFVKAEFDKGPPKIEQSMIVIEQVDNRIQL